jgi:hypothetical protein
MGLLIQQCLRFQLSSYAALLNRFALQQGRRELVNEDESFWADYLSLDWRAITPGTPLQR